MENLIHDRLSFAGGLTPNFDIAYDLDIDLNLPAIDVAYIVDKYMEDNNIDDDLSFQNTYVFKDEVESIERTFPSIVRKNEEDKKVKESNEVLTEVNLNRITVYYIFNLGYTYKQISEIIHPDYSYEAVEGQLKRDKRESSSLIEYSRR